MPISCLLFDGHLGSTSSQQENEAVVLKRISRRAVLAFAACHCPISGEPLLEESRTLALSR